MSKLIIGSSKCFDNRCDIGFGGGGGGDGGGHGDDGACVCMWGWGACVLQCFYQDEQKTWTATDMVVEDI